jgi:nitrogen regulatory protein PII
MDLSNSLALSYAVLTQQIVRPTQRSAERKRMLTPTADISRHVHQPVACVRKETEDKGMYLSGVMLNIYMERAYVHHVVQRCYSTSGQRTPGDGKILDIGIVCSVKQLIKRRRTD